MWLHKSNDLYWLILYFYHQVTLYCRHIIAKFFLSFFFFFIIKFSLFYLTPAKEGQDISSWKFDLFMVLHPEEGTSLCNTLSSNKQSLCSVHHFYPFLAIIYDFAKSMYNFKSIKLTMKY